MEGSHIEYRVEDKYIVTDMDIAVLSQRLRMVMQPDAHQQGDCYEIRSIYFDDLFDSCMEENEAGVNQRKKYRIRTYGAAGSPLNLEMKEKRNGFIKKAVNSLTQPEFLALMQDGCPLAFGEKPVVNELLLHMRMTGMRPKALIAYERTAFVHPSGNVRITFDRNIVASNEVSSFGEGRVSGAIPVLPAGLNVLEVKYDEMLPDMIAKQLEIGKLRQTAFSKYYLGRLALMGEFLHTEE